jgi:adenylate cyclase
MSATPDSMFNNPAQLVADLQRQLAECKAERDEALQRETATAEVLQVINSSPGDLKPVFDAILDKAHSLCGAEFGSLFRYDGERFRAIASHGVPGALVSRLREGIRANDSRASQQLIAGEPFAHVHDSALEEHAVYRGMDRVSSHRTLLSVPLRKGDLLLGMIVAGRLEVRPFTDKQIALLQNFAAQAVIAMENARLLTETREALEQQTATAEVLQVINSSPGDLTPVFDAMLERAIRLCGAVQGALWLIDSERARLAASQGLAVEFVELLRDRGGMGADPHYPLQRVRRGERVIHYLDMQDSGLPFAKEAVAADVRTLVWVALVREGIALGAFAIARREVRAFSDKETALLQNFAAQAVIAMENARLLTETREALEQQTATAEVLQVINSSPGDLTPVFDAMLEKAMRLCGAAFGSFLTFDGEHFLAVVHRGVPAELVESLRQPQSPTPGGSFERLVHGELIVHLADISDDDAYRRGLRGRVAMVDIGGARTAVWVALRKDDALLGALVLYRQEIRLFTDKQIALLQNFAAQSVIAMENARLITETREALKQQTATADVLQVINSSPGDLKPVFEAILQKAHDLCGAGQGALFMRDGERFKPVAFHDAPEPIANYLRQYGLGPDAPAIGPLLDGARFVHIPDMRDIDHPGARAAVANGVRTLLSVPLRKDGLVGTINAVRFEVRPFIEKEISLLENFAAQAVIAMENARLIGELHQRTDEVAELNRGLEARVAEQVEELGRVWRLKRFLAPQLAELIVSQGDEKILESHRREIVVVFCDLRGYTAFTETAEPEEVLDFLREYHGALGPLVSQFEGTLDQFSGDGIMVFFNDPVPIPDPAARAVKMAVAMRKAAGTLIADWRERGRELGFGAGIAQGYATLGQIGFSERSGYTAIGTVCNVAARLCAEAKDGQILLSQRVNVALRGSLATEQVGALALKGLTQPVVAFNVPLLVTQPALRVIEGDGPQSV